MNSSDWKKYPKETDFPRVGECPDCYGMGLRIKQAWKRRYEWDTYRSQYAMSSDCDFFIECDRCEGFGKIIPPEWLTGNIETTQGELAK